MTIQTVIEKLQANEDFADRYSVEVQEGGGVARLIAKDYGDLPIWVTADSVKTTFTSDLIKVDAVEDVNALNSQFMHIMGSGQVALSSFGIEENSDGDSYVIIGTLSTDSKPEVMLLEVNTLASNAIEILESL